MNNKDSIKESLTLEDIASLVEEFGGNPTLHGGCLMCDTICHNHPGEGSHKLYYYDNTKLFNCYTGCHESFDIYQLIVKAVLLQKDEEWSLPKAIGFVANRLGFSLMEEDGFNAGELEDWKIFKHYEKLDEVLNKEKKEVQLKIYDDAILKAMAHPIITPWLKEGISQETLDRFEISYYPKECQIVIPHRDIRDNLIGIRGRTMVKEEGELYGKYRPIIVNGKMYNHPLGFALYGLNLNKKNISLIKKAIIFEGEKSVMLYDTYFGSENNIAVASCGSSISNHQFELLLDLGVEEIVIAYDRQFKEHGDDEFKVLVTNLKKTAEKFKSYATVSCLFDTGNLLGYKSSPIDHGRETFLELFKNRILL